MSDELSCNSNKCKKVLNTSAYITVCSHAFCEDHGSEIAAKSEKVCPACNTSLARNFDFVKANLNPNEQFKSMVLVGLRPEIILDIASRGLMFWGYQKYQEHLKLESALRNLKESLENQQSNHAAEQSLLQTELDKFRRKHRELEREIQCLKSRNDEICEKLNWKERDIQKYQLLCETLKKKNLITGNHQQSKNSHIPQLGPEIAMQPDTMVRRPVEHVSSQRALFDFQPQVLKDANNGASKLFIDDLLQNKEN